ncbi:MAG: very short patch repair endonuclease [Microbacterium gubbeenense]|uniref:very short patch repair endonuclease n=1 Tax=Microbacteriaceae TaxID=85023 RepID=UPI003F92B82F
MSDNYDAVSPGTRTVPAVSSEHARRTMKANRRRDTSIEVAVRTRIFAAGARYRVDFAPDATNRRRRADIVFTRARIAIYIDGCFWHGCGAHFTLPKTNVEYWSAKIARNRERDVETTERLASAGWLVLRFWEHEDPDVIASTIMSRLRSRGADELTQARLSSLHM